VGEIQIMLLHYLILVLETLFFVGLGGSMVVAILAFIGDFTDFFEKDKPESVAIQSMGD